MLDLMWQGGLLGVAEHALKSFDVMTADVGGDRTSHQPYVHVYTWPE